MNFQNLYLRNFLFLVLQPGIVVVGIPYLIIQPIFKAILPDALYQILAILLFTLGFTILLHCIAMFIRHGKGTLSPVDPTKQLVVQGLYRYSRNPMYVGVLLMLLAECLFFLSMPLCLYFAGMAMVFHAFICIHEEPRLKKCFGAQFEQYQKSVKRWF